MNTVITHFYNEEYLLPWWIEHHKKIFDNGILINYGSTDRSVEICKDLCPPTWKIVDSKNEFFEAEAVDIEVKNYESTVEGFKMALNTTEFLLIPKPLEEINKDVIENGGCIKTYGVCMVDNDTENLPLHGKSLIKQKHNGMIRDYRASDGLSHHENHYNLLFGRFYHNKECLNYLPGRHHITDRHHQVHDIFTLKYKFSPWNKFTKKRIQQFKSKIPKIDIDQSRGIQHLKSEEQYFEEYADLLIYVKNLTEDKVFFEAYKYSTNL